MVETYSTTEEKLNLAIMSVMLRKEFFLFKCILYHYKIHLMEDSSLVPTAGIRYNANLRKFEIMFSPDFVDKLRVDELRFVILHEVLHALHKHIGRDELGKRFTDDYAFIWNLAGDHVINTALKQDAENSVMPIKTPDEIFIHPDLTAMGKVTVEEAYEYLLEKAKENSNSVTITVSADGKSAEVEDGNGNKKKYDLDIKAPEGKGSGSGKGDGDEEDGEGCGGDAGEMDADEAARKLAERALSEVKVVHQTEQERGRGFGSGSVMDMLEELIKVDIPTEVLLERAVARKLKPSMENRSWRTTNRVYNALGLTISGRGEEESIDTCVYAIDSSGSICDEELRMGGGAVVAIKDLFSNIIVLKHDWVLLDEKHYEGDLNDQDLLQIKGRGGTCHTEIFDRIEELYLDGETGIGIVILYTDFESNVEELVRSNKYEWVEEIPIQVMIPEGRHYVDNIPKDVDRDPITVKKMK